MSPPSRRRRRALAAVATVVVAVGVALAGSAPPARPAAAATAVPQVLFGMGDEISGATATPIYAQAPVDMVTSWYNGPGDLGWMTGYRSTGTMSQLYGQGKALELVVWLANHARYALSTRFQHDLASLVTTFRGNGPHYGPLYIVLFTEFETYSSSPTYTAQLMQAYVRAVATVHAVDPSAKVALGLGGYDWSASRPVRDLTPYAAAFQASDFVAVQEMQSCTNEALLEGQVRASVAQLGTLGKPVMISHFKLWGTAACQTAAFGTFESHLLTDASMATLTSERLFAWGFMNDHYINDPGPTFTTAVADLTRYGAPPPP